MERAESAFERVSDTVNFTPPEALFIAPEQLETLLEPFHVVEFDSEHVSESGGHRLGCVPQPSFNKNFDLIANLQANHRQGYHNVIVAGQATQIERLQHLCRPRSQCHHDTSS